MLREIQKALALVAGVKNPFPAVLDRLGRKRLPYVLHSRGGLSVELRPDSGDLFGFYEIVLRRDYLSAGQNIERGSTVIDVGANIGCFSLVAAALVGSTGRVFAIEPEESTYQQLLRNIEINHLTNIRPLRQCVGGRSGVIALRTEPNRLFSSVFSSVNDRPVSGVEQIVGVTTLEELMRANGIERCDYLKLDCEGAEHDIVATMTAPLAARIAQITLEEHKVPGFDPEVLRARLASLGYRRVGNSALPYYLRSPLSDPRPL